MRLTSVFLIVVLWGCRDRGEARLGIVLSQDGVDAAVLAVDDIKASGQRAGQPLSLRVIPESYGSAVPAITAAETLAADETVIGVVGHSNSASTLSASTIYNEKKLSHIAPTSTVAVLAEAGPYSFRMVGSDLHQAEFLVKAIERHPLSRIAILFVNDDYGRGIHENLQELLRSANRTIVYEAPYAELDRFGNPVENARAIVRNRPEILFWLGRSFELARVLPHLRQALPDLIVIASDGVQDQLLADTSKTFIGVQYVHIAPAASASESAALLARRFRAKFHYDLTALGLRTYDAVKIYAEAFRAGGQDREQVRNYLASLGRQRPAYNGASGPIQFDSTGAMTSTYSLMTVLADRKRHPSAFPIP